MSSDAHSGGQELRITGALSHILATQRGALFPWAPVFLAIGVGAYFSVRSEPSIMLLTTLAAVALVGGWIASRLGPVAAPFLWALVLVAMGVALAGARAHQVAGPQIGWRYYGPIQGRIVGIDRSASDAVRIVLDRVVLKDIAPQDTPRRVRLSLHGDQDHLRPWPGQVVITTGHLSVSNGPVEPGGFDFRRHAWFLKLGAVGYVRSPVLLWRPPDGGSPFSRRGCGCRPAFRPACPAKWVPLPPPSWPGTAQAWGRTRSRRCACRTLRIFWPSRGCTWGF